MFCQNRYKLLTIALAAVGFCSVLPISAHAGVTAPTKSARSLQSNRSVAVGEVSSNATTHLNEYDTTNHQLPTHKQLYKSGISIKVLGHNEVEAAGPAAGGAAILNYAPGVNVLASYGTGAAKAQISIDGIKQGWGNPNGTEAAHSISISFDGIPMNDPATGLWQSPEINQSSIIKGVNVTYGPGNPQDRWFNNIGGGVDFVPLQPTAKPGAKVGISYGSYDFKNIYFNVRTGDVDGFSAILAGGVSSGNSFLNVPTGSTLYSPSGIALPSRSYAWFFKARKTFKKGDDSFGAYLASGSAYKPYDILLYPGGATINGYNYTTGNAVPGPQYSEQTSGYYGAVPYKIDTNSTWMLYNKLNVDIGSGTTLHNDIWYRNGNRLHNRYAAYGVGAPNTNEYNNPHSSTYGDKLWFDSNLPYNDVAFGGYFIKGRENSRNAFFSSYAPYYASRFVPNDKYRSDYLDVTDLAAFLQDHIHPISSLDITPGVRIVSFDMNYTPFTTQYFPEASILYPKGNQSKLPASSRNLSAVEPSINISWRPIRHLALYAGYSEAYQTPAFGGPGGPFQALPASSISLEKGQNYQAGFKVKVSNDGLFHHFFLNTNWFFTRFSNQYLPITLANGNVINAYGTSDYEGVNIYAVDNPLYWLHLFANLSLQKAYFSKYTVNGGNYNGLPVANVPSSTLNIGAYMKYYYSGVLVEPRFWVQYTGPQSMFNNIENAPSATAKTPAYTLVNLSVHTHVPMHVNYLKNVSIDVDVLNLLGRQYNTYEYITSGGTFGPSTAGDIAGWPGAPRTVYVSLSANF